MAADGDVASLTRRAPVFFGQFAASWSAQTPSAGTVEFSANVPGDFSGDDIVWVAGFRADERFVATDKTEKVLRLIISGAK